MMSFKSLSSRAKHLGPIVRNSNLSLFCACLEIFLIIQPIPISRPRHSKLLAYPFSNKQKDSKRNLAYNNKLACNYFQSTSGNLSGRNSLFQFTSRSFSSCKTNNGWFDIFKKKTAQPQSQSQKQDDALNQPDNCETLLKYPSFNHSNPNPNDTNQKHEVADNIVQSEAQSSSSEINNGIDLQSSTADALKNPLFSVADASSTPVDSKCNIRTKEAKESTIESMPDLDHATGSTILKNDNSKLNSDKAVHEIRKPKEFLDSETKAQFIGVSRERNKETVSSVLQYTKSGKYLDGANVKKISESDPSSEPVSSKTLKTGPHEDRSLKNINTAPETHVKGDLNQKPNSDNITSDDTSLFRGKQTKEGDIHAEPLFSTIYEDTKIANTNDSAAASKNETVKDDATTEDQPALFSGNKIVIEDDPNAPTANNKVSIATRDIGSLVSEISQPELDQHDIEANVAINLKNSNTMENDEFTQVSESMKNINQDSETSFLKPEELSKTEQDLIHSQPKLVPGQNLKSSFEAANIKSGSAIETLTKPIASDQNGSLDHLNTTNGTFGTEDLSQETSASPGSTAIPSKNLTDTLKQAIKMPKISAKLPFPPPNYEMLKPAIKKSKDMYKDTVNKTKSVQQGFSHWFSRVSALWSQEGKVRRIAAIVNYITGYDKVTKLKENVIEMEKAFAESRTKRDQVKKEFEQTTMDRLKSQREINLLLQRKNSWEEGDIAQFTTLYKKEHTMVRLENELKQRVHQMEKRVDICYNNLVESIQARYHEEQNWSDKIRTLSSYSTWAVLAVNITAIFLTQLLFEPRKRRKIIEGVDKNMAIHLENETSRIEALLLKEKDQVKIASQTSQIHPEAALVVASSVEGTNDQLKSENRQFDNEKDKKLDELLSKIDLLVALQNGMLSSESQQNKFKNDSSERANSPTTDLNVYTSADIAVYSAGSAIFGGCLTVLAVWLLNSIN